VNLTPFHADEIFGGGGVAKKAAVAAYTLRRPCLVPGSLRMNFEDIMNPML